ncbi:MAG: archaellum operon transcriptional activator EarA family protein [Candidatus Paceibacterota bacterium]
MSKNSLELIFESKARLKILKFLFRNIESDFDAREMADRIQEDPRFVKGEIKKFVGIGLLKVKK